MIAAEQRDSNWTYVYLSNDIATASQGDGIGLKKSYNCTNVVQDQSVFGSYVSKNLNSAIGNYRTNGLSVQSQLNK